MEKTSRIGPVCRVSIVLGCLGLDLVCPRAVWGFLGSILGLFWGVSGLSWGGLGVVLAVSGLSWAYLGLSWGILGGLGDRKAILDESFTFSIHFRGRSGLF